MNLKNKKILITGGSGFIGTNLIIKLKELGADILNVSNSQPRIDCKTYVTDLRKENFEFLNNLEFDYVIHLAAYSNRQMSTDFEKTVENNFSTTYNLLTKLSKKRIKKIVFTSSIVLYSQDNTIPLTENSKLDIHHNHYAFSKRLCEQLCEHLNKNLDQNIVIFRLPNIYGPYQDWKNFPNLIPQIMSQAILKRKIEIMNLEPIRDWVFVDDITNAMIQSLNSDIKGIYNLGSNKGTSVKDIVETVSSLTNAKIECSNQPVKGQMKVICDISKIKKDLNWEAKTDMIDGLKKTFEYYKKELTKI